MNELLTTLVLIVAIAGSVVPVVPGALLAAAAVIVSAVVAGEPAAWIAAASAVAVLALGQVAKWVIPARRVAGTVSGWVLAAGGVAALIGFVMIPLLGLPLGFLAGVMAAELVRTRSPQQVWPATRQALVAAGWSALIELLSVVLASGIWLVIVVLT